MKIDRATARLLGRQAVTPWGLVQVPGVGIALFGSIVGSVTDHLPISDRWGLIAVGLVMAFSPALLRATVRLREHIRNKPMLAPMFTISVGIGIASIGLLWLVVSQSPLATTEHAVSKPLSADELAFTAALKGFAFDNVTELTETFEKVEQDALSSSLSKTDDGRNNTAAGFFSALTGYTLRTGSHKLMALSKLSAGNSDHTALLNATTAFLSDYAAACTFLRQYLAIYPLENKAAPDLQKLVDAEGRARRKLSELAISPLGNELQQYQENLKAAGKVVE